MDRMLTPHRAPHIEPVDTTVTALLGSCRRGPADEPVVVQGVADFDQAYGDVRGSSLRRSARDFFSNGGRHALTVRVTDGSTALANLAEHDWQILVVDPGVVDLAEAYALCLRHHAFLVSDAAADGSLPDGLGRNAAAYFPSLAGSEGSRPCAPAVAGVFARTDANRGVWKAPSGTQATLVDALSRELTQGEIDRLSPQVNALRSLPAVGAVVWGARTASVDPEWKYVPVRRLVLFLERSIERGLQWVVFEPNGEPVWARVRLSVENFLFDLWRQGALVGDRPDEGYFVRCDLSTMTQADVEAGRLVVLVGVAALKPAEFLVARIEVRAAATA